LATVDRMRSAAAAPAGLENGDLRPESGSAEAPKDRVSAKPLVEALHAQIAALTSRLDRIRTLNDEQRPAPANAEALRAGLASITRSVADLAPRNAAVALGGVVGDLNQRLDVARKAGASDSLIAPVETVLREILTALRTHDPHAAIEKLNRELRTLSEKVDALIGATTSPETLERIRKQTEEIRDLLTLAAKSPFPFERLERQVGNLADRVERLATSASPLNETERVVELLSEVRAQIERATPRSLLGAIELRLDRLTARVDEALDAPETPAPRFDAPHPAIDARDARFEEADRPAPPLALEDLVKRIEGLRATVERQGDFRLQVMRVEAALADIKSRLDRPSAPAPDFTALTTTLRDLAIRLDKTFRQPAPVADADRGEFETALSEVSAKLDRNARSADEIKMLAGALGDLKAHLDDDSRRAVDADLISRALTQISAKLDAISGASANLRPIELALGAINDKIDARDNSQPDLRLVEQVADLINQRLGSGAELERAIGEMLQQLEALRRELQSSASAPDLQREILDLRAEQSNADRRTSERLTEVQGTLERLFDQLGRMESDAAPAEALSRPAPIDANEDRLRDIPDRAPARPHQAPAPNRSLEASNILLEPGASAPKLLRGDEVEPTDLVGRSGLNSHIAAARRAAQAALVESASKKLQRESLPSNSNAPTAAAAQSRLLFRGRRRPVLLALVLIATAATAAVIEWRPGWPQAFWRQQVSAPARSADPGSPIREDAGNAKPSVDYSPVGNVAPPAPKTSVHPAAAPAPADLLAAIPANLAQSLRDQVASGDPRAETELGLAYLDGRTIPKDPAIAARWLELAAVQGLPVAQYRVATLYEKGNGVARDTALARAWYLKAANAGNARAMHNLAVLIAEDPHDGKPDYAEAAHWFRQAGGLGVRDSQFNLGVLYGRGLGVPQDLGQSWLWFSLAARQGDADAAAKRDEFAAKLDANAQAAASKALAEFKTETPSSEANEPPSPGGPQSRTTDPAPVPAAPPAARGGGATGVSG
jgi:localization factor PodJL